MGIIVLVLDGSLQTNHSQEIFKVANKFGKAEFVFQEALQSKQGLALTSLLAPLAQISSSFLLCRFLTYEQKKPVKIYTLIIDGVRDKLL